MSELEEKLNAVLNDPAELERISRLAAELMGDGGAPEAAPAADGGLGEKLGGLLGRLGGGKGGGGGKAALVAALAPYLHDGRREKLAKAARLAQAARLAGAMLREEGKGGGL